MNTDDKILETMSPEHANVCRSITSREGLLGNGSKIPYAGNNSGTRLQMVHNQTSQILNLIHGDVPYLSTGNEDLFGMKSSSYVEAESCYQVIAILHKYENNNKIHYYVLVKDILNNDQNYYDIIERVEAKNTTETYGFVYDNRYLDSLEVGSIIDKGDVITRSDSFTDELNRKSGVNLLTAYVQKNGNEEDAIIISESARKKLGYRLIHKVTVTINENDIPLNLYGDEFDYKVMPDTGEYINNGMLIATRRVVNTDLLFSQSNTNLRKQQSTDEVYYVNGKVVDIKVMSNNNEVLETEYFKQLKKYHDYSYNFYKSVVNAVDTLIATDPNHKISYQLSKLYWTSKRILEGATILYNNKKFNNIVVEFLIVEENYCNQADKMSDRYGGKGEISKIVPDEMMPRTEDGRVIDIMLNPSSIVKRQNLGTIIEPTINMLSYRVLQEFRFSYNTLIKGADYTDHAVLSESLETLDKIVESLFQYIYLISQRECDELIYLYVVFDKLEPARAFIRKCEFVETNLLDYDNLYLQVDCSETMDLKKLENIYYTTREIISTLRLNHTPAEMIELEEFMYWNEFDSAGMIVEKKSRRPITIGHKYMFVMKQLGVIDHAAVSASNIGQKGDNIKSTDKKKYKSPIKGTPIRFGEMEIMNLVHLGDALYEMMMLYSSSVQGRRSLESALLEDDIFKFSLKISPDFKNRAVEILNAYMTSMGIRLSVKEKEDNKLNLYGYIDKDLFSQDPDDKLNMINTIRDANENAKIVDINNIGCYIDLKFIREFGWISYNKDKKGVILNVEDYRKHDNEQRDKLD